MHTRARSEEDKSRRSGDLLAAAEAIALDRGGVRYVTVAEVTERVGLHRTGARRYYGDKEELLLELAELGWRRWTEAVATAVEGRRDLSADATAGVLASTIGGLPVFCDLLTHVAVSLEGEVSTERARRYKAAAFAASDALVNALAVASALDRDRVEELAAATTIFAAAFWQVAHPTESLAAVYADQPRWAHVALDFEERLGRFLRVFAAGLVASD